MEEEEEEEIEQRAKIREGVMLLYCTCVGYTFLFLFLMFSGYVSVFWTNFFRNDYDCKKNRTCIDFNATTL